MKRLLAIVLTICMIMTTMSVSVSADSDIVSNSFEVVSKHVPEAATAYAREMFTYISPNMMNTLGFSSNENLRIGAGFTVDSFDSTEMYFFPIYDNDVIKDFMVVVPNDTTGGYGMQIGSHKDFASALTTLNSTFAAPVKFYRGEEGNYIIQRGKVTLANQFIDSTDEKCGAEFAKLSSNALISTISAEEVVTVSVDNVFPETRSNIAATGEIIEVEIMVPFVGNGLTSAPGAGVCWAASAGSILAERWRQYNYGNVYKEELASIRRQRWQNANPGKTMSDDDYGASSDEIVSILSIYSKSSSINFTACYDYLRANDIIYVIEYLGAPFIACYRTRDGKLAHAVTVHGLQYDSADRLNMYKYVLLIMDPNTGYEIHSLDLDYCPGWTSRSLVWYDTVIMLP